MHLAKVADKMLGALECTSRCNGRQASEIAAFIDQAQRDLNGIRAPIRKAAEGHSDWASDNVHTKKPRLWREFYLGIALEILSLIVWFLFR